MYHLLIVSFVITFCHKALLKMVIIWGPIPNFGFKFVRIQSNAKWIKIYLNDWYSRLVQFSALLINQSIYTSNSKKHDSYFYVWKSTIYDYREINQYCTLKTLYNYSISVEFAKVSLSLRLSSTSKGRGLLKSEKRRSI